MFGYFENPLTLKELSVLYDDQTQNESDSSAASEEDEEVSEIVPIRKISHAYSE